MSPSPSSLATYFLGLDLGQAQDYSAVCVLESADDQPPRTYAGRHLQRWALGTAYPDIAADVARLAERIAQQAQVRDVSLAVDATGVGRAVVDLLRRARMPHVRLIPILITGGDAVTKAAGFWHVPKRDLIGCVQVLLQTGRLKIAAALPEAATLTQELMNFQMKITTAGHETYGAWREGTHDDLVLGLACAVWAGERRFARFAPVDAEWSSTPPVREEGWGWRPL
jgi:hypothetical protein